MSSKKKQSVPKTPIDQKKGAIIKEIEKAIKENQRLFILSLTNQDIKILWSDLVSVWEAEAVLNRVLSALHQQQPNQKKR